MSTYRVIPSYNLYGESAPPSWSNLFDFEWIPQRSKSYDWVIQPHQHDAFIQVLHLTSGDVSLQMDDLRMDVAAPALMVVPAGVVHGWRFSNDIDGPVVTATQRALESLAQVAMPELLPTLRKPLVLALHDDMRYVEQLMPLFLNLERESKSDATGQVPAGLSLLLALMIQIHRISELYDDTTQYLRHSISRKARQVEKFRAMVERNFREKHSVQEYAQILGVSAGQLTRLCREIMGKSASEIITNRILNQAQRDLIYTIIPINQMASDLGFQDDAYFSRFFKKHILISPKSFRKNALNHLYHDSLKKESSNVKCNTS